MSTSGRGTAAVDWVPWNGESFARARREHKPILLSIAAGWSHGCREMDRVTFADHDIAALVNASFVPVRVDADERPDVAERFDLGGLPTTAFLTPDAELIGGGTFIDAARLRAALPRVLAVDLRDGRLSTMDAAQQPRDSDPARLTDAALTDTVFSTFDRVYAGFGDAPKFPHVAPVRLALDMHAETGNPLMLECATRTLDAMGWGELYDEQEQGFFRYCASRDWTRPAREKLLVTNAALLDLYLSAGEQTASERWFARAADIAGFIERTLRRRDDAWRAAANVELSRVLSDANAVAVSAMLHAADVFKDDALGKRAVDVFEHALLGAYKPGDGVAHCGGGARALLTDQVGMATAALDAWEATGNIVYRMMAEELMHFAIRTMWDDSRGAFFDRAPAVYSDEPRAARRTLTPFVLNCDAAIVLRRLAEAVNDASFQQRAVAALAAVAGAAASHGPLAAHYLIARRAVLR